MNNPFVWLGISILLVAVSLVALLTVAVLTLQELARAARSAEKLLDTLNRELPVTLNDLRMTGRELSGLTDDVSGGVQSARNVVEQVDRSLVDAKIKAQKAQITTRSFFAGASAALQVLANGKPRRRRRRPPTHRPSVQSSELSHKSTESSTEKTDKIPLRHEPPPASKSPLT